MIHINCGMALFIIQNIVKNCLAFIFHPYIIYISGS